MFSQFGSELRLTLAEEEDDYPEPLDWFLREHEEAEAATGYEEIWPCE